MASKTPAKKSGQNETSEREHRPRDINNAICYACGKYDCEDMRAGQAPAETAEPSDADD